ncbi:hypothetical protein HOP50_15g75610 [Chloropicon primus]|uniref:Uncharacterized protein n=1 Tax=Chloropicon primus TaxID=1764295 RepID=A0A5B8MZS6_9CHLO|nr:hypothetical protein A3770_15p75380 [Chloropicon primus]UPR04227.1 hypothetical protein HOP50_15g75610 [Chloropicon primus]|eukprot:QDZ25020.1 hypothetical protein A3770_15p75380 [Chloropicon primus]
MGRVKVCLFVGETLVAFTLVLAAIAVTASEAQGDAGGLGSGGAAGNNTFLSVLRAHLGSVNLTSLREAFDDTGSSDMDVIPLVLTKFASNWLNSTYATMFQYYSVSKQQDNQTVTNFIAEIAANAIQDIVVPGANLCLTS